MIFTISTHHLVYINKYHLYQFTVYQYWVMYICTSIEWCIFVKFTTLKFIYKILWVHGQEKMFLVRHADNIRVYNLCYIFPYWPVMAGLGTILDISWDQYIGIEPLICTNDDIRALHSSVTHMSCTICSVSTSLATAPCTHKKQQLHIS